MFAKGYWGGGITITRTHLSRGGGGGEGDMVIMIKAHKLIMCNAIIIDT